MNTINHLIDPTMVQRIDQMAKNLAVASIFSQHPQQDDDYERVLNTKNPMGKFTLDNFYLCDDYLFDHADKIIERLESEYDKLKDFAWQVLAVNLVNPNQPIIVLSA
jgi:alpha-N-acetylglucosamine transferase